jgi:putative nucleotidyltransferase with HDIG domain
MQKIDQYSNQVKHLPPAPRILPKLLSVLGNPDMDSSKVVEIIALDPSLTASVLQLCNSAFLGAAVPAADLPEAVNRLGFNQVYRVVAAVCGSRALSRAHHAYGYNKGELWQHSVAAAVAAQYIAEDLGADPNVVFTAALLHDIGKIILAEALTPTYLKLIHETEKSQQPLLDVEKNLLGVQHAEAGARLLSLWQFPENLVAAVCYHHQPNQAGTHARLAAYVYLGNMIAHFMGFSFGHLAFAFRGRTDALHILKLTPDHIPQYMIRTHERLEEINALLGHRP